jgi:hypothetical protein
MELDGIERKLTKRLKALTCLGRSSKRLQGYVPQTDIALMVL